MSHLLHHEACPNCGSRDNLGVYSDGHKWCFTPCGFYVPPTDPGIQEVYEKVKRKKEKEYGKPVYLPEDFTHTIPPEPLQWIKKYGITEKEIIQHRFGWSHAYKGIIFPIFDIYGNLLLYQRRGWPEKDFHTEGRPELVDSVFGGYPGVNSGGGKNSNTITVVEDVLSAIKVSRCDSALPLWVCSFKPRRAFRLARYYDRLNIWLDFDKRRAATKLKIAYEPLFESTHVIITDKDPKEQDDAFIERTIRMGIENSEEIIS